MVAEVARQNSAVLLREASSHIERIADERMSGCGEVDAYLVRPARRNLDLKQRAVITPFKDIDMAVGWFSGSGCGVNGL